MEKRLSSARTTGLSWPESEQFKSELLLLIRENTVVWRARDAGHKNLDLKKKAYEDIADQLNDQFGTSHTGESIAKEFKVMKDYFARRRRQLGASGDRTKKPWRFDQEMEFLLENDAELRRTSASTSSTDTSEEPPRKRVAVTPKLKTPRSTNSESGNVHVKLEQAVQRLSEVSEAKNKTHSRFFADYVASSLQAVEEKDPAAALRMKRALMETCFSFESDLLRH